MLGSVLSLFTVASVFVLRSNNDFRYNVTIPLDEYHSVDTMIAMQCPMLLDRHITSGACKTIYGARVISQYGKRILRMSDVHAGDVLHMVFATTHFVYHQPLGHPFKTESGFTLTQISHSPRIFTIEERVLDDYQIDEIISTAAPSFYLSTTGDPSNAAVSKFRTSENTIDISTNASKAVAEIAFNILAIDHVQEQVEPMQVVRYAPGQYYLPHTDFFETDPVYNPVLNNGTNRFATLFIYLNTIKEGGETIFPFAHEQRFLGSQWDLEMFLGECVPNANVIRESPVKGKAILFYSQHPNGTLDRMSTHGACPPLGQVKMAANLWMWNRPKILDGECPTDLPMMIQYQNVFDVDLDIYWDTKFGTDCSTRETCIYVATVGAKNSTVVNTFLGHVFHLYDKKNILVHSITIREQG